MVACLLYICWLTFYLFKIRHHYARFIRNYMKLHANSLIPENRDNGFKIWFWLSWLNVYIESPYWQPIYMGGKKTLQIKNLYEWNGSMVGFLCQGRSCMFGAVFPMLLSENGKEALAKIIQWSTSVTPYVGAKVA